MTDIRIDPNVRVRNNQTYAGFEDVLAGPVMLGRKVTAVEVEEDVRFPAIVTDIDAEKRLIYLAVDWRAGS